jgi:hypothetical protein
MMAIIAIMTGSSSKCVSVRTVGMEVVLQIVTWPTTLGISDSSKRFVSLILVVPVENHKVSLLLPGNDDVVWLIVEGVDVRFCYCV